MTHMQRIGGECERHVVSLAQQNLQPQPGQDCLHSSSDRIMTILCLVTHRTSLVQCVYGVEFTPVILVVFVLEDPPSPESRAIYFPVLAAISSFR